MIQQINNPGLMIYGRILEDKRVSILLDRLKQHHPETLGHSLRVGSLTIDLLIEKAFSDEDVLLGGYGGILHDVGKLCIDPAILSKNGPLTPEEWAIIRCHPQFGYGILKDFGDERVRQIVVSHHKYQKNPYPVIWQDSVLIPDSKTEALTQAVAACDMYDALSSKRSYKARLFPDLKLKKCLVSNILETGIL